MAGELITSNGSAIAERRAMLPNILSAEVTPCDRLIFEATTEKQIQDYDRSELSASIGMLMRIVARDVGYIVTDKDEWTYTLTRICTILITYYGRLTLNEIKMAFELAAVGELDKYLPRDKYGKPDASHYQRLNAEYIGKILGAYKQRRSEAISNVYDSMQSEDVKTITPEQEAEGREFVRNKRLQVFEYYKQHGQLPDDTIGIAIVYKWLCLDGYADVAKITEEDMSVAYGEYKSRVSRREESPYKAASQLRERDGEDIRRIAELRAERREISRAFDAFIRENKDVTTIV